MPHCQRWRCVVGGSPPRTWGRSLTITTPWLRRTVHPHARGDDEDQYGNVVHRTGSPPRTWGRYGSIGRKKEKKRFTPTHVGTMRVVGLAPVSVTVHPHARGDDSSRCVSHKKRVGSPPRTWGRYQPPILDDSDHRFTPTHVGTIPGPDRPFFAAAWFTPTHVGTMHIPARNTGL